MGAELFNKEKIKIYDEPSQDEIRKALVGNLEVLWNVFKSMRGNTEFDKAFDKVKMGTKIEFDIRAITEGYYEVEPAYNRVRIERRGIISLTEYRDEIDRREMIMKEILRGLIDDSFDNQEEGDMDDY